MLTLAKQPHSDIMKVSWLTKKGRKSKCLSEKKTPEINMMKQNYCNIHRDWKIVIFEWFIMSYFGSSYGHFSISRQKLRWNETKIIVLFLFSFKKMKLFLEDGPITPKVPPQLRHCYLTLIGLCINLHHWKSSSY